MRVKTESAGHRRKRAKSEENTGEAARESEVCLRGVAMIYAGLDICLGDPTLQNSSLLAMGAKIHFPIQARGLSLRQYMVERGMEPGSESE